MKIVWSLPVPGESLESGRGDVVRASRLIACLRSAGHEVVVVAAGNNVSTQTAVATYRAVISRIVPGWPRRALRDVGRALNGRAHARHVMDAVRRHQAELIIETQVHLSDSGAVAARACGLPLVLDDCSPAAEETILGRGLGPLARSMFSKQVHAAAALTVSSTELRERLVADGVPARKVAVVSNGVDVASYRAAAGAAARLRWGIGTGPVIGFAGSFQPWHNVDLLVRAVARVRNVPVPLLLLAGSGPGLGTALSVAQECGVAERVRSIGPVPPAEIPLALAACDIAVLPGSNDYGQPMKLLEYAAAGLPILAPDLAPVRALITNEFNGLLFHPGDDVSLSSAIRRLLGNEELRRRLGATARSALAAPADWRHQGRELLALAERVA